ncbi:MAG: NfeD family protein [Pseudomonadota bacterium]
MTAALWWIVALALGGLELLSGTFYLLLLALAAAVTAIATWLGMTDGVAQGALFSLLALLLCGLWSRRRPAVLKSQVSAINQGSARWLGRELVLPDGIVQGQARVQLDDSHWTVHGPDCAPGRHAVITAVEGNVLVVTLKD